MATTADQVDLAPTASEVRDVSLHKGLGREAYLDPERFEAEQRMIFARSWNCVGRSAELGKPGAYLTGQVAGESILVVRQRNGSLRAFRNLCRHRGARLCLEPTGALDKAIRCPYHAWTYGLDGHLIAAPNASEMPDLDKAERSLLQVPVEEWAGYAWVRLAGEGTLAEQVEPQLQERFGSLEPFARYQLDRLAVGHRVTYDVASNWKSIVENFMECYHCASLHPELTEAVPEFASGYGTVSGGVGRGAAFAGTLEGFSRSHRAWRPRLRGLLEEDDRLFFGVVLLPGCLAVLVPDHVAFFRIEPLAPGRTLVHVDWLFEPDEVARADFDPSDSVELLDLTNRQDFSACERCQLGATSEAFETVLAPPEHIIENFHRFVAERLGQPTGTER